MALGDAILKLSEYSREDLMGNDTENREKRLQDVETSTISYETMQFITDLNGIYYSEVDRCHTTTPTADQLDLTLVLPLSISFLLHPRKRLSRYQQLSIVLIQYSLVRWSRGAADRTVVIVTLSMPSYRNMNVQFPHGNSREGCPGSGP